MSKQSRGRPDFDPLTEAQLLAGRTAGLLVHLKPAPDQNLTELLNAIDHVTEAATGDRSFLHLEPAVAPTGSTQIEPRVRLTLIR
jgi:hypothetical protein